MLNLSLEPTDDRANPLFRDASSCAKWLAQLQLTNMQLAHSHLLTQINELNRYPMPGLERLNTLEQLRETVGYVQDQYSGKLASKPLPLNESELMVLFAVVQLWHALVSGYQRCLQDYMAGDRKLAKHAALLCQRCLLYSGLEIFEHLRVGYEFDAKLWQQLHGLYAFAEERGFHSAEVADPLNSEQPRSSCQGVYARVLLACHARPAELSRAQLHLLDAWLTQWSGTVTIDRNCTPGTTEAQPLALDMSSAHGLWPVKLIQHSDSMRYLEVSQLSKLLRAKIALLQQGKTPQQSDLGSQGNSRDCIDFLKFLHQCWCEEHSRFGERPPITLEAHLCSGIEDVYAQLTGRRFKPFGRDAGINRKASEQIEVFGRVLQGDRNDRNDRNEQKFQMENWHLENGSILGARLTRKDTIGGRLSYDQLVAVRPDSAETFTLGATAWARVTRAGQLQIGVRFLPGAAKAISICATGINATTMDKYAPALLLQAVPALKMPHSLIIPRNWFQRGRVIEVTLPGSGPQLAKMGLSVERGIDFERVSFTLL
ncbi:MAG: hypothetical protein A2V79_12835 [Betaproteobacteria bacterium RBG_16_56_24]|nr:MAG: hypothetical protein A2V79_12835 [Betaproteobacteria bacterium RBG_16_56_24]